MTSNEAAWNHLIADLYLSVIDRDAASRLPNRIAALTNGNICSIWRLQPKDYSVVGDMTSNLPLEAAIAYRDHYFQYDPWAVFARQVNRNSVQRGTEVVDDHTVARSVFYNEFGAGIETFHLVNALVPLPATGHVGAISILRPKHAGAFDQPAIATLERALPHIAASFHLREQLDAVAAVRIEALDAALDAFGLPAIVLDGHGTVLRVNALAEQLHCVRQALTRRNEPDATLRLTPGPDHDRWTRLVTAASNGNAGGKCRLLDRNLSYIATVTPLPARLSALTGGCSGRVLMLLRPLESPRGSAIAADILALTPAEANVAAALLDGLTPVEIAASRDVKISTVRTLLQRAQNKAGCRNLRDLVRLLTSLG